jgi:hypothetical protein
MSLIYVNMCFAIFSPYVSCTVPKPPKRRTKLLSLRTVAGKAVQQIDDKENEEHYNENAKHALAHQLKRFGNIDIFHVAHYAGKSG